MLDRNGNGEIDDGTELFGDSTPLLDADGNETGKAEDGFAALANQDSNGDGLVNNLDANWHDLRVWQDANSDGISQADELKTLEALDIAGIRVAKTENTTRLANGNQIADLGTFIKTDGSENTLGNVTGNLADVDLADNPFFREFTDTLPLTPELQALPDMRGSGTVRDLREAASLNPTLASTLTTYAAATTKASQLAQADAIITQWAASSGFQTSIEKASSNGYQLTYLVPGQTRPAPLFGAFGGSSGGISVPTAAEIAQRAALQAQQQQVTQLIATLEKFNGMTFVNIEPQGVRTGANQLFVASAGEPTSSSGGLSTGGGAVYLTLSGAQIDFMNRSYAALRQSIYDGLLLQTRLKPYTDAINLTLTETGLGLDFSATEAAFQSRFDAAPGEAARDLLDLQRIAGANLNGMGWNGLEQLRGWLVDAVNGTDPALTSTLVTALTEFGYPSLRTQGDGTSSSDVVIGAATGGVLNGNGGNDLVLGSEGNDILNGGSGVDTLYGGAGDDTYVFNLGDGADTIIETHGVTDTDALILGPGILAGDLDIFIEGDKLVFAHSNGKDRISIANWFDSIADAAHRLDAVTFADGKNLDLNALQLGTAGADTLTGTDANDILMGGPGEDILTGEAGDDWLNGGTGADQMAGGVGDDIYVVDNAGDGVVELEGEGTDTVFARISATLSDNVENLTLVGTAGINGAGNTLDNTITGNAANNLLQGMGGNDTLIGNAGNDTLDGGLDADSMTGGTGDDAYIVDNVADTVTELANQGLDTVYTDLTYTLGNNLENLTLTGSAAVDGAGNELNNVLTGNAADNILMGLAGNDTLDGGLGADTLMGGTGDDSYLVDGVTDLVIEQVNEGIDIVKSSISYTLTDNTDNLTLTGTAALDGTGNALDNVILGNDAANTLTGLEGNDTLDGKGGADTLIGGTGNDTYVVDGTGDVVIENLDEGTDTVQSGINYILGDNLENLTLTGTAAINGSGNELDNVLIGNGAANTLDGGVGADAMAGGAGNDTYILDNLGDTISEGSGQGTDTVISPFDYTLGTNVDNLTLTGTALNGTGNALDNAIIGTAADNTLIGLDGNDTLDGGLGADVMTGGSGNDSYVVDTLLDTVTELAGEGVDTVYTDLTYTLGANLDNLTLTGTATGADDINGTGNELNNVLTGNDAANTLTGLAGDDTLDGSAGADTLLGGTGNDSYVVDDMGDVVIENASEGTDTVKSGITYTLGDDVENLTLTGTAAINGTGNVLDNIIIGNNGINTLTGLEGNDTLNGGAGADTMLGSSGNDTYIVDNTADTVIENPDEGTDLVQASATYTLSTDVENLTLTGTAAINGTGNALNNTITGNNAANVLDGGLGADALNGGAGNDTYVVDNVGDIVSENPNAGTDTVQSGISYTLTDNVENLVLTGAANLDATGNALNNDILGNSADNVLSGLAGSDLLRGDAGNDTLDGGSEADLMLGGQSNDTYIVDNAGDLVGELANEGTDTVQSSVSYTLTDNVENLVLTGTADLNGTGNTLDNTITGNSGANIIDGRVGADAMMGDAGDDTYIVDNIGDVVTENLDEGIDFVQSSITYTLTDNVENLTLTGTADLNGIGNALDNTITGTSGNNTLDGGTGADTLIGAAGNDTYFGR